MSAHTSEAVFLLSSNTPIHDALAAKGLSPSTHLVDAAYVSAGQLVGARERYGIKLLGPTRKDVSWQHRTEGAFGLEAFMVDWDSKRVRCPEGGLSVSLDEDQDKARGRFIKIHFGASDCQTCPSRMRCTRAKTRGRQLSLRTQKGGLDRSVMAVSACSHA